MISEGCQSRVCDVKMRSKFLRCSSEPILTLFQRLVLISPIMNLCSSKNKKKIIIYKKIFKLYPINSVLISRTFLAYFNITFFLFCISRQSGLIIHIFMSPHTRIRKIFSMNNLLGGFLRSLRKAVS